MRLLDRYLLRELLVPLAFCLGGFLIFYVSFDLIGQLKKFQEHQMLFRDGVEFYLVTTPETLVTLAPVALLLSLLYVLTNHARHNELTAMRAAGVSLWRLSLPYFAVGFSFAVAVFAMNEMLVPQALEKSEQILERRQGDAKDRSWRANLKFHNESENRFWDVKNFNLITGEMIDPKVIWEFPNGARREIYAERATYANGTWTFFKVEEWDSPNNFKSITKPVLLCEFSETPELIRSEIKFKSLDMTRAAKRPQLSIAEISSYRRLHPRLDPKERATLMTQYQSRLAEPWKCVVVVLIAIPFGARSGRRNVFVGVASSIFICFGYLVLQWLSVSLGMGNYLPPVVAAWLPAALFSAAGIVMTTRMK